VESPNFARDGDQIGLETGAMNKTEQEIEPIGGVLENAMLELRCAWGRTCSNQPCGTDYKKIRITLLG
jgi:hypothetical protein